MVRGSDGFIEQFQTDGFNSRIWELYLFAAFVEMGYGIDRSHASPDFSCRGLRGEVCVEAVTVNPTLDGSGRVVPPPPVNTPEAIRAFERHYMPIRYGSPLTSKLARRYWEREHVAGKPLVFAIHDFHAPLSMLISRAALPVYLYGYDHEWERDEDRRLHIRSHRIESHRWGKKVIPSGFFDLPDAENISAVLFSNSGTISKFDRMGILAGFGSPSPPRREGIAYDNDPNATEGRPFRKTVSPPDYTESWTEGISVYHNHRANVPLDTSPFLVRLTIAFFRAA
jgi:hypothetical protein